MPVVRKDILKGLTAKDRTPEEKEAINEVMGRASELPDSTGNDISIKIPDVPPSPAPEAVYGNKAAINKRHEMYLDMLDQAYQDRLEERKQEVGTDRNTVNTSVDDYLDKVANEASSYYKKYKGTDKLPLSPQKRKELVAEYDARRDTYGKENADIWLDRYMKNEVGEHQSWFEQATHAVSHLIPAIEGGAIQTYGMLHGAIAHIAGAEGYRDNPDLNWWDSFVDDVIDNPVTRYGRDVEMAGTSHVSDVLSLMGVPTMTTNEAIAEMKGTATKYNPEGIGQDAIVTTEEQDHSLVNATTPWQGLQSGGFTALSMVTGWGEAKAAGWLFGNLYKGANWLNKTGKIIRTEKGLERTLEGLRKVQNFVDTAIIPGAVGSVEGAMEGLNTKIEVERDAVADLDAYYNDKVSTEAEEIYKQRMQEYDPNVYNTIKDDRGTTLVQAPKPDYNQIFKEVWDKYKDEYAETRRQIDWASSKAGIHDFYVNSLINGMINTTLKAGLMHPRVQESIRNSKVFGRFYKPSKFNIDHNGIVTPKKGKAGIIVQMLKEPYGEALEEYSTNISSDVFSSAASNNINQFILNKFEGKGDVKVTDTFGSDYAAALTALGNSLTSKESLESAILGAVSSSIGTIGGIGRGYHRDENNRLVRNDLFDIRNFQRGLNSEGEQESISEYLRRVAPWRSGLINAYYDSKDEYEEAKEAAANMTEWLKDPQNKAKWDGLVGTANWMTQMENAAESNDQFNYRTAQMGKTINDVVMLSKLKGTAYYDSVMQDLQRAASGEITAGDIQKLRQNGGEEYQNVSDQEIVEKVKSNANKMLGIMTTVEQESKNLDRLLGRVDEDTKQSLIFGKVMLQDFKERRSKLKEELESLFRKIESSADRSKFSIDDDLKKLILQYGSINKALKTQSEIQAQKEHLEKRIEELEKIDPEKLSDKQKEELARSKRQLGKTEKKLEAFSGLYKKDEKGRRTEEVITGLHDLVLNEEEIMQLDPITRAIVLAQGTDRLYNATHQDIQKVEQLNLELDEIQHQIDSLESQNAGWRNAQGKIKKGHNKQYQRNLNKLEELKKQKEAKMRELDAEQGKMDSKPVYNSAQQEVIDNLVQQGIALDEDFLDKVVDMGRLEQSIKNYHSQYQSILSDPKAFENYVQKAKYIAQRDLTRRRATRVANIQDYKEYASELDILTSNVSPGEKTEIMSIIMAEDEKQKQAWKKENVVVDENTGDIVANPEQPETNFDRYQRNRRNQSELIGQFINTPGLTDNDQSLLLYAMQYLTNNGVDITDRNAAVQALIEKDELGNLGGKFRQWVEERNDRLPVEQRAFMPQFTSIGQVVSQYVDLINGVKKDRITKGNLHPGVTVAPPEEKDTTKPTVLPSPSPSMPSPEESANASGGTTLSWAYASPDGGQIIDGDGTVATDAQLNSVMSNQETPKEEEKSEIRKAFEQVTTPEIAKLVDERTPFIDNSPLSDEIKDLARQYLMGMAVNSNERYPILDDLLTALQEQINRLKAMSNMQEKQDNIYNGAAGILTKMYSSLYTQSKEKPEASAPPANVHASELHTENVNELRLKNPYAWTVRFADAHRIDYWNRDHVLDSNTPVYFITDSEWSREVADQTEGYNALTHMPVVAAVRVETPQDPAKSTAIEVGGIWYQPVAILPNSNALSRGAATTYSIRQLASQEQGRHLVPESNTPNASPLKTKVNGANYLMAHHRDAVNKRTNSVATNSDVQELIINTLPVESRDRLMAMPVEDRLNDEEYKSACDLFFNGLEWGSNPRYPDFLAYTPDNRRLNEKGSPMLVFDKKMSETTGRTDSRKLPEVLREGSGEEVVNFNSRTSRLYHEVIRPLFQHLITDRDEDRSAQVITQQKLNDNPNIFKEEADRLARLLNGYNGTADTKGIRGVGDFVFITKESGWRLQVTAPEDIQVVGDTEENSKTFYKVRFVNSDPEIESIDLGYITAGMKDTDAAMELLRNLLYDVTTGQVRSFLKWQLPKNDAKGLKDGSSMARRNYTDILNDGIFEIAGTSLTYDIDGMKLHAPIASNGRIVFPSENVSNKDNAQLTPPNNVTPMGDGAVAAGSGQTVDPNSGAVLGGTTPPAKPKETERLRKAKELTERIVSDSKEFKLSEDEKYYYILNKTTGERRRYLRVTTVIAADESAEQWVPTIESVLNKLKETHSIKDSAYTEEYKDTSDMSQKLGIPEKEIKRAVAELRTIHKNEAYGAWSTPSTSIGNTFDSITRDFLAGHLQDSYVNITKEVMDAFVRQLEEFKADLDSRGIHIVPNGVMAHGTVTMTDKEGNTHKVDVGGTLDLFGYDDNGNFYIFDMKTTRDHSTGKLIKEKAKWSRQISMYADLLKQSYPDFDISDSNLMIIPINVDYPAPEQYDKRTKSVLPVRDYRENKENGQLQVSDHLKENFKDFRMEMPENPKESNGDNAIGMRKTGLSGQVKPGYTKFNINWDNLSSEDQDIANALATQATADNPDNMGSPQQAEIETPSTEAPGFLASDADFEDNALQTVEPVSPGPIIPAAQEERFGAWENLSESQKEFLKRYGIEDEESYIEEILEDPASLTSIEQQYDCYHK